ncbi:hypothetical protein BKH41_00730 [Helicobacter sp. 12S02232-10]|uniref:hypothetical protein n=1 Tax=Helicobacter sp. 12S02232-10 TaxID=1476197 RepID=UPI000BA5049D|nr:hypothetical protein [Helicobacter sp. 12S02232-10]PAF49860.1 hypothetical protein BKH41_00730 [Helicobacter sp. 12S02232-10]
MNNDYFEEVSSYQSGYDASWFDDYEGFKPKVEKDKDISSNPENLEIDTGILKGRKPKNNKTLWDKFSNKLEDVSVWHREMMFKPLGNAFESLGAWGKKLYYLAWLLGIIAVFYYLDKTLKIFKFTKGAKK